MSIHPIGRNSLILGLFALFTAAVIAATWLGTRERIAGEQRRAEEKALLEIVPLERHDNSLLDDTLSIGPSDARSPGDGGGPARAEALQAAAQGEGLALRGEKAIHLARWRGEVAAVILPVTAPDGYSGDIDLIVGINRDGTVAGVRVLAHRETPGLGDKLELRKSPWVLSFNGRSLEDPEPARWAVRKDGGAFDQFTGATITPRAATAAVKRALEYFAQHRQALLAVPPPSAATGGANTSAAAARAVETQTAAARAAATRDAATQDTAINAAPGGAVN